jgi:type IV secretion system protein VirD4
MTAFLVSLAFFLPPGPLLGLTLPKSLLQPLASQPFGANSLAPLMVVLVQFALFLAGLAVIILVERRRKRVDGKLESRGKFARKYLRDHWKSTTIGFFFWINEGAVTGLVALLIARAVGSVFKRPAQQANDLLNAERKRFTEMATQEQEAWIRPLGQKPEDRVAGINEIFDRKERTVKAVMWADLPAPGGGFIGFRIARNLAGMDNREREFLRTVELLAAMGWDEAWCTWKRFGLIWGDGKASIEERNYNLPNGKEAGVKDDKTAIAWYAAQNNVTVDSVINDVLKTVESLNLQAAKSDIPIPVLQGIKSRLTGGSAWLSAHEIPQTIYAPKAEHALRLGVLDGTAIPLAYAGEGSIITIAPPGSGKTQCHVFPNLLTWKGPAVVLDVKGEIYAATSKWRKEHVGPVFRFSPLEPDKSQSYNPLTQVRSDPDFLWEDARFLADMMIVPSQAKDPFWENKARDVLQAAIAHTCLEKDLTKRPMSKLIDVLHGVGWDAFVTYVQARVDIPSMQRAGHSLAAMDPKQRESVLQTAQSSLSAWSGQRVERTTRKSDWSPLDLRNGANPTIYICLKPSEVDSYISVLRVLIAQHIRVLCNELPPRGSAPILFLLDELPRLKHMPPVEEALEIGRQYGVKLWMFAQSVGQLENAYENAEGMIGSCAVRIYMNPSAADGLAEKLSESLGYRESALDSSRQRLVEAAELTGPAYRDLQIVIGASSKPAKVAKAFAWQDPELKDRTGSL